MAVVARTAANPAAQIPHPIFILSSRCLFRSGIGDAAGQLARLYRRLFGCGLAAAEARGEMRPLPRRLQRWPLARANLDREPAARPERAAFVEPGQIGRLALD